MTSELTTCAKCGRLFKAAPGQTWCMRCAEDHFRLVRGVEQLLARDKNVTPESISEAMDLPLDEVRELVKGSRVLRDNVRSGEPCQRCRVKYAEPGIAYCAECRDRLKDGLSSARDAVYGDHEQPRDARSVESPGDRRTGVRDALEEKRRRRYGRGSK